jgi:hypothetical protein
VQDIRLLVDHREICGLLEAGAIGGQELEVTRGAAAVMKVLEDDELLLNEVLFEVDSAGIRGWVEALAASAIRCVIKHVLKVFLGFHPRQRGAFFLALAPTMLETLSTLLMIKDTLGSRAGMPR